MESNTNENLRHFLRLFKTLCPDIIIENDNLDQAAFKKIFISDVFFVIIMLMSKTNNVGYDINSERDSNHSLLNDELINVLNGDTSSQEFLDNFNSFKDELTFVTTRQSTAITAMDGDYKHAERMARLAGQYDQFIAQSLSKSEMLYNTLNASDVAQISSFLNDIVMYLINTRGSIVSFFFSSGENVLATMIASLISSERCPIWFIDYAFKIHLSRISINSLAYPTLYNDDYYSFLNRLIGTNDMNASEDIKKYISAIDSLGLGFTSQQYQAFPEIDADKTLKDRTLSAMSNESASNGMMVNKIDVKESKSVMIDNLHTETLPARSSDVGRSLAIPSLLIGYNPFNSVQIDTASPIIKRFYDITDNNFDTPTDVDVTKRVMIIVDGSPIKSSSIVCEGSLSIIDGASLVNDDKTAEGNRAVASYNRGLSDKPSGLPLSFVPDLIFVINSNMSNLVKVPEFDKITINSLLDKNSYRLDDDTINDAFFISAEGYCAESSGDGNTLLPSYIRSGYEVYNCINAKVKEDKKVGGQSVSLNAKKSIPADMFIPTLNLSVAYDSDDITAITQSVIIQSSTASKWDEDFPSRDHGGKIYSYYSDEKKIMYDVYDNMYIGLPYNNSNGNITNALSNFCSYVSGRTIIDPKKMDKVGVIFQKPHYITDSEYEQFTNSIGLTKSDKVTIKGKSSNTTDTALLNDVKWICDKFNSYSNECDKTILICTANTMLLQKVSCYELLNGSDYTIIIENERKWDLILRFYTQMFLNVTPMAYSRHGNQINFISKYAFVLPFGGDGDQKPIPLNFENIKRHTVELTTFNEKVVLDMCFNITIPVPWKYVRTTRANVKSNNATAKIPVVYISNGEQNTVSELCDYVDQLKVRMKLRNTQIYESDVQELQNKWTKCLQHFNSDMSAYSNITAGTRSTVVGDLSNAQQMSKMVNIYNDTSISYRREVMRIQSSAIKSGAPVMDYVIAEYFYHVGKFDRSMSVRNKKPIEFAELLDVMTQYLELLNIVWFLNITKSLDQDATDVLFRPPEQGFIFPFTSGPTRKIDRNVVRMILEGDYVLHRPEIVGGYLNDKSMANTLYPYFSHLTTKIEQADDVADKKSKKAGGEKKTTISDEQTPVFDTQVLKTADVHDYLTYSGLFPSSVYARMFNGNLMPKHKTTYAFNLLSNSPANLSARAQLCLTSPSYDVYEAMTTPNTQYEMVGKNSYIIGADNRETFLYPYEILNPKRSVRFSTDEIHKVTFTRSAHAGENDGPGWYPNILGVRKYPAPKGIGMRISIGNGSLNQPARYYTPCLLKIPNPDGKFIIISGKLISMVYYANESVSQWKSINDLFAAQFYTRGSVQFISRDTVGSIFSFNSIEKSNSAATVANVEEDIPVEDDDYRAEMSDIL